MVVSEEQKEKEVEIMYYMKKNCQENAETNLDAIKLPLGLITEPSDSRIYGIL